MPEEGVEGAQSLDFDAHSRACDDEAIGDDSESARYPVDADAFGPAFGPAINAVESALARALDAAATAGRFDVVAQLARELEARRLARSGNVVSLESARAAKREPRGEG